MNRFLSLFCLALCWFATEVSAQQKSSDYLDYIKRYETVAVAEMYRSGIPASITLAQGLLESGAGKSQLAIKSNNHFGIKCHNGWQGGKVYHDDDAKGECFRKYDTAEDSYRDHSDFLRYRDRYRFLFEYKLTDYVSWAHGLKKAGYATDPNYPRKLIAIIDLYELYKYDSNQSAFADIQPNGQDKDDAKVRTIPLPPSQIEQTHLLTGDQREIFRFPLSRKLYSRNGVVFIYSVEEETYASIAQSNRLFLRELLRFNELKKDVPLPEGTIVYLQKKKNQAAEGLQMHVIEKGETLRGISQRYGVRMKRLCRLNDIQNPNVIREGDIIKLRK